jgi:hypothetical protein
MMSVILPITCAAGAPTLCTPHAPATGIGKMQPYRQPVFPAIVSGERGARPVGNRIAERDVPFDDADWTSITFSRNIDVSCR